MNLILKAVYYCATNGQKWGKAYTIKDAKKNAGVTPTTEKSKTLQYYVQAALFNDPTEAELKNLHDCITANQIDGSPNFYTDNRTEEDEKMITEKHVGWLMIEKNY